MRSKKFIQGLAWAVAELNRGHDEPTMCQDVLLASGYSIDDLIWADVDDFDLYEIRGFWPRVPDQTGERTDG